jgi:hypothetical protein
LSTPRVGGATNYRGCSLAVMTRLTDGEDDVSTCWPNM